MFYVRSWIFRHIEETPVFIFLTSIRSAFKMNLLQIYDLTIKIENFYEEILQKENFGRINKQVRI